MVKNKVPEAKIYSLEELEKRRQGLVNEKKNAVSISVCGGTNCVALGADSVVASFRDELAHRSLHTSVNVMETGCPGLCEQGPLVIINWENTSNEDGNLPKGIFYRRVKPSDVPEIVTKTVMGREVVDRLLYDDTVTARNAIHSSGIPFFNNQLRHLLGVMSQIDSTSVDDYIASGGYKALAKTLFQLSPADVINEIKQSGLRGRGGAGFYVGAKWESARKAPGNIKYIVCNADEGDPGAFKDRNLLGGNPHGIIEGMLIAAYAVGASQGYIYICGAFHRTIRNTEMAIKQAEEYGLLGENILGSGFSFTVSINRGGGAYVCGESSALMVSLEGKPGEPRAKYVHATERGLWNKPTVLNNVETLANIPLIINRGAEWFSRIGTATSKGTKIFSLVGKIKNTGLVEVPMGISLREIIFDIGGGILGDNKFKAVQTGGPSGGCIPESLLDLPVDFDALTKAGSMMGSGGMIVMDESTCMVDIAKYFITFLEGESCGKCVPCREGLKKMREILTDITEGRGQEVDTERLEQLARTLECASLCALGGQAPNAVRSTIKYFRDEYDAHIREKRCPAGVCKALVNYSIDETRCNGCRLCIKDCPSEAITFVAKKNPVIMDRSKCIRCGTCYSVCKLNAVIKK
jgi:NADH-quinone oxidoreductase subunit F